MATTSSQHDEICNAGSNDVNNDDAAVQAAVASLIRSIERYRKLLNKLMRISDQAAETPGGAAGHRTGNGESVVKSVSASARATASINAQRADKVTVYVRMVFLKIGEIDTLKEHFTADAFIQARWAEPRLNRKNLKGDQLENIDWRQYWNPKLYVENNLGEPKESIWQTVSHNINGEATVCERRRIKGCFLENLELGEFPFDTQDLTITLTSERSDSELELEEDTTEISSINVQSFVDEQEWKLHSHVETWKPTPSSSKIYQTSKHKHPAFSASCRASRRPGFFIWNIFLVMLFICSLTFSTFSVDPNLPQNRLQLAFILLLTTISFKFVVCQTLPQISYLTYLDKYILTSMAILCSVCIWHAIVPVFHAKFGADTAGTIDRWGLGVCASAYCCFHICFFLYIYLLALHKRWKYDRKDKEHRDRIKQLQMGTAGLNLKPEVSDEGASSQAEVVAVDDVTISPMSFVDSL